ncbi:hypothetical protein Rhopal_006850-T1 [Rhodotorula paludigena]|uniref:Uncharacterized protein n=1 Tax=Rhodotorula paludigena TaxID=86838 RepID=A0AAV5GWT2_9BASI|nr:hypothetical protein Rhopal_006850-T1 [Rhodotorula paludigena]
MGENELDLSSFTFSYDVEGCPAPHIFSPAEACDLLSAFGGVFTRGDSLMRQFTQGLFILLSNSFAIANDPDRLCTGNSIFTNGKHCKTVSIFNSRELEHVCSEEPFVAYDQIWKFSHEQGVQDKVEHHAGWIMDLLNGYQTFVSSVPANRRRYSPVSVVSDGIHYGWRVNATLEMHLLPFLSNTSSANPRPIPFFSSYPAVPPNKIEKFAVKQGPERTKRYNAEIRKVLSEISPGELYQGAMHQLEWYNSTDGAVSFDGTHYSYQREPRSST